MTTPSFWDLLTLPTDGLVRMGIPRGDVVARRFASTGQVCAMDSRWLAAIFMWGRTHDLHQIAAAVGVDRQVVKDHGKRRGLHVATRACRRTQAELAMMLWADRARSPEESCERYGVLPVHRRVLCAAAQELIDGIEGGVETVMGWTLAELDRKFEELNVVLRPPARLLMPELRTPAEHDEVLREQLAREA